MKYHVFVLIVLMAIHTSCSPAHQPAAQHTEASSTLTLGMSHTAALEIIRNCGGQDITSGMAIMGPNGERPPSGLYWTLKQYNSVLEIAAENGNVVLIDYWTAADFSVSKNHRAETRRSLKSLTFNRQTGTVQVEDL